LRCGFFLENHDGLDLLMLSLQERLIFRIAKIIKPDLAGQACHTPGETKANFLAKETRLRRRFSPKSVKSPNQRFPGPNSRTAANCAPFQAHADASADLGTDRNGRSSEKMRDFPKAMRRFANRDDSRLGHPVATIGCNCIPTPKKHDDETMHTLHFGSGHGSPGIRRRTN
jgi:hypothetical protein